ncbi:MAG: hotdog fold thioesterase [Cytophagales bacterium]|nr:MAG: hotdog fold thioesterase [Cytophagales bacterium]TAF62340.1 MAG: hotdog fold thioesterase [Cytophagales bacterium]
MTNPKIQPELYPIAAIGERSKGTILDHLGIEITEIGEDFLCGKMPVDERHIQPAGILHGGASVVLAETLGSMGTRLLLNTDSFVGVGLEVNANHLRPVAKGDTLYGRATLVHAGRSTHIWDIKMSNDAQKLCCISRLTVAIIPNPLAK